MKNNKLKLIVAVMVVLPVLALGNLALASEATGTLSTGLNSTVGNALQGVVGENISLGSAKAGEADMPAGATSVILTDTTALDLSAGLSGGAVTLQSGIDGYPIVLTNLNLSNVSASIPDGTTITGPAGWDGKITPPISGTPSGGIAPAGFSVGSTVISIGSPEGTLVFDKPVTILLAGVTGAVGYRPSGSDTWVQITNVCGGSFTTPTPPTAPGECAISNGADTKIVTYHFSSFGSLVATPAPASVSVSVGGGGGGGGGYYNPYTVTINSGATQTASANVTLALTTLAGMNQMWISNDPTFAAAAGTGWIPFQATYPWTLTPGLGSKTVYASFGNAATATPAENAEASITVVGGQVLGASTSGGQVLGAFNFASDLSLGSQGNDVTELQRRLTQEGLYSGPNTGYFGPLTLAGVKAYQNKYGVPQTGFVGPLTRARLNGAQAGGVLGASTSGTAALQAQLVSLQTQLVATLQKLLAILQAQVTH